VDAVEIERIGRVYEKFGERFLNRVYTDREATRYRGRINELAARFAAKEAVSKALGTGLNGIRWREVEVMPDRRGKPLVYLYGRARERAESLGLTEFAISLTHARELAIAFVVAT
jgi:holo-[acyl-carrier protein] synthase